MLRAEKLREVGLGYDARVTLLKEYCSCSQSKDGCLKIFLDAMGESSLIQGSDKHNYCASSKSLEQVKSKTDSE